MPVHVKRHVRRHTGRTVSSPPPRRYRSQSRWYIDGFEEGRFAAQVNLETPEGRDELRDALEEDRLGEIAGEIRDHQVQMAGDISYDVDRPGGPTEAQYEKWEEGFYDGFEAEVRGHFGKD